MRLPAVQGLIRRRVLVNFRVRPAALTGVLPARFRPVLIEDWAIGGICFIRLEQVRPRGFPVFAGLSSENAAHRIAVEWDGVDGTVRGVYIPRRDSSSWVNTLAGGRVFSGPHHRATFRVADTEERVSVEFEGSERDACASVVARRTDKVQRGSVFKDLAEASAFFQGGSLGYSAREKNAVLDGIELRCLTWNIQALEVEHVRSGYFQESTRFSPGDVEFDSAFIMRDIEHEWVGRHEMSCSAPMHTP